MHTAASLASPRTLTLPGNERYYDFVRGDVHLFAIDSDRREPSGMSSTSVQAAWLQSRLAASTARWQIVYFHHPPYSSGSHGNTTAMQWPFRAWGADAVLSGHDHTYERIDKAGFPYMVNGLGGRSRYSFDTPVSGSVVRYNANYGAQLVEADESTLVFKFYDRAGSLIDTLTLGEASTRQPVSGRRSW
jgi:tartrate-resistant acid phosphatase type 5